MMKNSYDRKMFKKHWLGCLLPFICQSQAGKYCSCAPPPPKVFMAHLGPKLPLFKVMVFFSELYCFCKSPWSIHYKPKLSCSKRRKPIWYMFANCGVPYFCTYLKYNLYEFILPYFCLYDLYSDQSHFYVILGSVQ